MRRAAAIVSGVAIATVMTVGLLAQAKPNFSGKWAIDQEKTTAANPALRPAAVAARRAAAVVVAAPAAAVDVPAAVAAAHSSSSRTRPASRESPKAARTARWKRNPSWTARRHDMPMGQATAKVTAKVDGATIVIETTAAGDNGTPATTKAVYSMEGDYLVIATTNPGRNGGEPTTRKSFYKKG